jgi:hypothetical protein
MQPNKTELVKVPSPSLGRDLAELLSTGSGDFTMLVEDEEIKASCCPAWPVACTGWLALCTPSLF